MIRWKKLTEEIPNHPCMYTFAIFILLKIDLKIPTLCYFSNNDRHRMVTAVLVIHFFSNPLLSPHWNIQNRWTNCLLLVRNIHFRGPHTFQESNGVADGLANLGNPCSSPHDGKRLLLGGQSIVCKEANGWFVSLSHIILLLLLFRNDNRTALIKHHHTDE